MFGGPSVPLRPRTYNRQTPGLEQVPSPMREEMLFQSKVRDKGSSPLDNNKVMLVVPFGLLDELVAKASFLVGFDLLSNVQQDRFELGRRLEQLHESCRGLPYLSFLPGRRR